MHRFFHRLSPRTRRALLTAAPLAVSAVSALIVGMVLTRGRLVLPEEGVHLFQANQFASGVLRGEYPVLGPWLSESGLVLDREGGWFAPVPPLFAVWLLPGLLPGVPHAMSALAGLLTLWLLTRIGKRLRFPLLMLPVTMLISPFFLFLHATLLPQTLGMLLSTLFFWAYVRTLQNSSVISGFWCGVAWGLLYFFSPWTAVLLAVPFAVHWVVAGGKGGGRSWGALLPWGRTVLFLAAAVPAVYGLSAYLEALTGGGAALRTEVVNGVTHGWLPFGEGAGETAQGFNSMQRGLSLLWRHVRLTDQWLFGTPRFTLVLWLGLAAHGWNRRWSPLFLSLTLIMFFGYLPWPQLDSTLAGPRYQAALFPFFMLFGSLGLHQIWKQLEGLRNVRRFLFLFLGLWGSLSSVEFLREHEDRIEEEYGAYFALEEGLDAHEAPILLFYRDPFAQSEAIRSLAGLNRAGMATPMLRVRAPADQRAGIRDAFPERLALTLEDNGVTVQPFTESFGDTVRMGFDAHLAPGSGRNTDEGRVAVSPEHQAGFLFYGWYPFVPPGRYEVRFDLRWEQIRPEAPLRLEVMSQRGEIVLAETVITGGLTPTTLAFSVESGLQIEPRVIFGGSGSVLLRSVTLRRIGPLEPENPVIP